MGLFHIKIYNNVDSEIYREPIIESKFCWKVWKYWNKILVRQNDNILVFNPFYTKLHKNDKVLIGTWFDNTYRIATCLFPGKLRNEPDIFDQHETPGVGYFIAGVYEKTIKTI